jgi:hypothetical protein
MTPSMVLQSYDKKQAPMLELCVDVAYCCPAACPAAETPAHIACDMLLQSMIKSRL